MRKLLPRLPSVLRNTEKEFDSFVDHAACTEKFRIEPRKKDSEFNFQKTEDYYNVTISAICLKATNKK